MLHCWTELKWLIEETSCKEVQVVRLACVRVFQSAAFMATFHSNLGKKGFLFESPVSGSAVQVFLCSWVWTLLGALPHLPNLSLLLAIPHRGGIVATCRFSLFDSLDAHKVRVWMHLCSLLFCQSQGCNILSFRLQLVHYLSAVTASDKSDKSDTKFSGCLEFCALQLANSLSV